MSAADEMREWLLGFALRGERAPSRDVCRKKFGPCMHWLVSDLWKAGRIRVEIYGLNWRVIEIDGHRTQAAPAHWNLNRVLDKNGDQLLSRGRLMQAAA